jgi:hypothetical protein
MKQVWNFNVWKSILFIVILIFLNKAVMAQDTTKAKVDTTAPAMADTTKPATTTTSTNESGGKPKHLIIYAGANSNQMGGSTENFNANSGVGYHIGLAWQKDGFVYWQLGLRYNNAVYGFNSVATSKDTGDLKVQALDIPLTVGINFLEFTKIASLRAFISAMPSFTLGVNDNHFGVSKDDVNSFVFYGQIGIGANLAFVLIDVGYNYGFEGLMKDFSNTKPSQWFLSLGVKF